MSAPKTYALMTNMERHRLARDEPRRYRELRRAHQMRIQALTESLAAARTLDQRRAISRELAMLTGIGEDEGPSAA